MKINKKQFIFEYFFLIILFFLNNVLHGQEELPWDSPRLSINAPKGTEYQNVKRGTVYIEFKGINCTGVLMNTVNQNGRFYILTAGHCLQAAIVGERINLMLNFEFEALNPTKDQQGMETGFNTFKVLAIVLQKEEDTYSDYSLIEIIDNNISEDYFNTLYFNGWSIRPIQSVRGIVHHSKGQTKKIRQVIRSEYRGRYGKDYLIYGSNINGSNLNPFLTRGSSGAGVFNDEKQVIFIHTKSIRPKNFPSSMIDGIAKIRNMGVGHSLNKMWDDKLCYYLDPISSYVQSISGGYGFRNNNYLIDNDSFNLTVLANSSSIGHVNSSIQGQVLETFLEDVLRTKNIGILSYNKIYNITVRVNVLTENGSELLVKNRFNTSDNENIWNYEEDGHTEDNLENLSKKERRKLRTWFFNNEKVRFTVEVINNGDSDVIVRAIDLPGVGKINAVELFSAIEFRKNYKNSNYPENRALINDNVYIDSLVIRVFDDKQIMLNLSKFVTSNNGGYLNNIGHSLFMAKPGNEVEIAVYGASETKKTIYSKVWIDYNKNFKFNDEGEEVLSMNGLAGLPLVGRFRIPECKSNISTRVSIAMSQSNPPPIKGRWSSNLKGEVEDYTIKIISDFD